MLKNLTDLIDNYFNLWIDLKFVDLSLKNWMKILLKSKWEFKIKSNAKIYSMNTKDKDVSNDTCNRLHKQEKLF